MKEIIIVIDQDPSYSKKFCNQAIKIYGKKYVFLSFKNGNRLKEYAKENQIEALIVSEEMLNLIDDIKANEIYILNERFKQNKKEGKKTYVYKLQNINKILGLVESDIDSKKEKRKEKDGKNAQVILFYTPIYIKNKMEIIKKIAKCLNKKSKVLIIDIDEFENYKGMVGFSNIIYNYKENKLDSNSIKKEIVCEKEQDYIKSVTYPEDFQVINSIDFANIINEIKLVDYDYIFINSDTSYVKCQYVASDADKIVLMNEKNSDKVDKFKNYVQMENQIDSKKITEYNMDKTDRVYMTSFVKACIEGNV